MPKLTQEQADKAVRAMMDAFIEANKVVEQQRQARHHTGLGGLRSLRHRNKA